MNSSSTSFLYEAFWGALRQQSCTGHADLTLKELSTQQALVTICRVVWPALVSTVKERRKDMLSADYTRSRPKSGFHEKVGLCES